MAGLGNRDEIARYVNDQHYAIKLTLTNKGYRFNDSYEDLEGGQVINNRQDLGDSKYYEELNYIKQGLSKSWSDNLSDIERFTNIRDEITDILNQYD
jgi:hypothetical protein